jgi:hypothetical protein
LITYLCTLSNVSLNGRLVKLGNKKRRNTSTCVWRWEAWEQSGLGFGFHRSDTHSATLAYP